MQENERKQKKMARDFLKHIPAYASATSDAIQKRRSELAKWLNEKNYKIPKGQTPKILDYVRKVIGRNVSGATIHQDARTFRLAFLYLTDPKRKEGIEALLERSPNSPGLAGVKALKAEGITTWEQVLPAKAPAPSIPVITDVTQVRRPAEPPTAETLISQALSRLSSAATEIGKVAGTLAELLPNLTQEKTSLAAEKENLAQKVLEQERQLAELGAQVASLKEAMSREHLRQLQRLAEEDEARRPALLQLAQEIEHELEARVSEIDALKARLPQKYEKRGGGTMTYEEPFLRALLNLNPPEQEQVIKALGWLSKYGWNYKSLQTQRYRQRLPHSPARCMVSRASDELRFSWHHSDRRVTIYWVWRRGESQTGQRER